MAKPRLQPVLDRSAWRGEDLLWLASHHPRPLAREFEERFNGGWTFRKGIPVTRSREEERRLQSA